MRIKLDVVVWTAAAAVVLATAVVGATATANADTEDAAATAAAKDGSDIAAVRAATAKYHDLAVAEADGFVKAGECVVDPAGTGTMGFHYIDPELENDPAINLEEPEALLYIPNEEGEMELVAVEWIRTDADQDLNTDEDRPFLMDTGFDGPMLGHGPGRPIHYDLHAWVWKDNPNGMLAQYNPSISCPAEG
jgi:hypothetical protein